MDSSGVHISEMGKATEQEGNGSASTSESESELEYGGLKVVEATQETGFVLMVKEIIH